MGNLKRPLLLGTAFICVALCAGVAVSAAFALGCDDGVMLNGACVRGEQAEALRKKLKDQERLQDDDLIQFAPGSTVLTDQKVIFKCYEPSFKILIEDGKPVLEATCGGQ